MPRPLLALALLGLFGTGITAQEPQPKLTTDLWDVAYLQGARAGYVHTYVQEFDKDGLKLLRATMEMRLTVLRSGDVIQLGMDAGTYESVDGIVVGTFLKHFLGKAKTLEINGLVEGNTLKLTRDGSAPIKPAPWNREVVGLARQQRLFKEHELTPGKEFSYLSFEPSVNLVVKNTVRALQFEEVELVGGKQKKRLLRMETRPERVQNLQLPMLTTWIGEDGAPVRAEAEIPPFGKVTLYRTTKAIAQGPAAPSKLTEIGTTQYVRLSRSIPNPYAITTARYRITIRDEENPAALFASSDRQTARNVQRNTVELQVSGRIEKKEDGPSPEFLQSSYFINSNDRQVRTIARAAAAGEVDPWRKALRIEKWVKANLRVTSDEALAPADHVARTRKGDCTEFAMLMAAMCRAEGIPSRTAIGLIYADVRTGPVFAFHMWTEVWINGTWIPLDATLGRGQVGATHLKISDHSWHETYDQAPLLPVVQVLGKLAIEVLSTDAR